MIAAAPHFQAKQEQNKDLEYLLLGDLRQVLEEPPGPLTSRWLLAILDLILAAHPPIRQAVYLPVAPTTNVRSGSRLLESASMIDKLRRLRDRVAHRSDHRTLADEIREELREVMLDRISSAACLFDA